MNGNYAFYVSGTIIVVSYLVFMGMLYIEKLNYDKWDKEDN